MCKQFVYIATSLPCRWGLQKFAIMSIALYNQNPTISRASQTQKSYHVDGVPNTGILLCRRLPIYTEI